MKLYDIIFIKQSPQKYYRHFIFWGGWFLFGVFTYVLSSSFQQYLDGPLDLYRKVKTAILTVLVEIVFAYPFIYFIVPHLTRHKRFWLFLITPVYITLCFFAYDAVHEKTSNNTLYNLWFHFGDFLGVGPVFICSLFVALRIVKNYYIRMEEREILEREKTNAELQFLKAQIHPHFLFNTLNNIYSFTLSRSPQAILLVRKLKDLLYYMTDECKANKVPLEKELKMLTDYIALEKVRYGKKLDIQIEVKGNYENVMITPLLMIPFVENSFKHGASKILNNPWIKIAIELDQNNLYFSIINNKPSAAATQSKGGIGLENVIKRLQLLYPNNHLLTVQEMAETFTVKMQVALEKIQMVTAAA